MRINGMGGPNMFNPIGLGGNPFQVILQMLMGLLTGLMGGQNPFFTGQNPGFGAGCGCGGPGGPGGLGGGINNFLGGGPSGLGGPGGAVGPNAGAGLAPGGATGNRLADYARGWAGRAFKPGQTKRCADFVSTMLQQSGTAPPGFRHTALAADFARYGKAVGRNNLQPGDVVLFGNTYRKGQYTHVGIYIGNGKFVHRPTANKPVRIDSLNQGYYAGKFTGGRRMNG